MKRPAAAAPGPVAKRQATAAEAAKGSARNAAKAAKKQCTDVARAVMASSDFPAHVLEMLSFSIPDSLGIPKESRHAFQDEVAGMIGDVLTKQEQNLQTSVAEAGAKLEEATAQKAEREKGVEDAEQKLTTQEEVAAAAQTVATDAAGALVAASEVLADARKDLAATAGEVSRAEAQKTLLASTLKDTYLPIKEGSAEPAKVKEGLATVVRVAKDFSVDRTLLESLTSAASKAPGDRGSFDILVLQQLDSEFQRCMAALEETIANAEPTKKEREEKVTEAAAKVEEAKSAVQESRASLEAAKTAQGQALAAKREASKALQQCGPEIKQAGVKVESAKASLEDFRGGPVAAYKALLEYTLAVPEQAKPEAPAEAGAPAEKEVQAETEAPAEAEAVQAE